MPSPITVRTASCDHQTTMPEVVDLVNSLSFATFKRLCGGLWRCKCRRQEPIVAIKRLCQILSCLSNAFAGGLSWPSNNFAGGLCWRPSNDLAREAFSDCRPTPRADCDWLSKSSDPDWSAWGVVWVQCTRTSQGKSGTLYPVRPRQLTV